MTLDNNKNKHWAALALFSGLLFIASQAHLMWILRELQPNIMMLQLSFNPPQFWQIWQGWAEAGQAAFHRHLNWDFIHPLIYGLFGFSLSRYLQARTQSGFIRLRLNLLAYLLPIAGVCDIAENLCHQYAVGLVVGSPDWHIPLAASFASVKWFLIVVFFIQLIAVVRKLRQSA